MLRDYQVQAVEKMLWAMSLEGNDLIMMAQGSGKTLVIAEFVKKRGKPILILVPNKELLEQDLAKLKAVVPEVEIGVYSASMNSKEVKKYTIATIQSAYKHPEQFAHYDVVIIDEADLVNPKKMSSMYMKFFETIGNPKCFGLTGTPYRQDVIYERWGRLKWQVKSITTTKMINRYRGFFWNRMLVCINTNTLMENGYLCPIEYHNMSLMDHKDIPTNKSKSEFDMVKFDEMVSDRDLELASKIKSLPHKSKIIYCASITHAERLQSLIEGSLVVTSTTTKKDREQAVKGLREGLVHTLLNVGIYTVGFDYPSLDCIVLLRPTRSLRLHSQILGRVARIAPGKKMGHVYDFVSNVKNMGKLEEIEVGKVPNVKTGKPMWNVTSPAYPNGFHYEPLFVFKLKKPKGE